MKIALLGAPATGKTFLAAALRERFAGAEILESTFASAELHRYDVALLMGLDLPGPADPAADTALRHALAQAGVSYKVVYGRGAQRVANALAAIDASLAAPSPKRNWVFSCDKCGDPACEHRLFRDLIDKKEDSR